MKKIFFAISDIQRDKVFAPIRSKAGAALLLMNTIKYMMYSERVADPRRHTGPYFALCTDKMKRLIYVSDKKIFSISFPYLFSEDESVVQTPWGVEMDSAITSMVIGVLTKLEQGTAINVVDFACQIEEESREGYADVVWNIVKELLMTDFGYLRYDEDPDNEDGDIHPLNHVDIFLHNSGTFKVGLEARIDCDAFVDVLNLSTDCYFLAKKAV